ncbi:FeoA family protein [Hydrogenobaculum sp. Y04AAS1]|uniref:FeoA domain-containing protein n=1 Tax=Hydrogenobaculum sp. (strain Y04AAS1) TaxID=380749 RepID=UPI00015BD4DD|nr:FeoA family protein [Hydrogenobaculum sp. Y04AAS1]HCT66954.1 ferrous iron transport protein A [Hydrogenobaculum sp.]
MKLIEVPQDKEAYIKGYVISGKSENPGWKRKLISMGIVPGITVKILRKDDRNTILKVYNSRISICNYLAEKVEVE